MKIITAGDNVGVEGPNDYTCFVVHHVGKGKTHAFHVSLHEGNLVVYFATGSVKIHPGNTNTFDVEIGEIHNNGAVSWNERQDPKS